MSDYSRPSSLGNKIVETPLRHHHSPSLPHLLQPSSSLSVMADLSDWAPPKKTWDPWSFDYDEMTDERREELRQFGARCRANSERTHNDTRFQCPPDDYYFDSSDTDDGSRTPTGLLSPDPEARVVTRPRPSNPAPLHAYELNKPPYKALSAAEYAAERAAIIEAQLDKAASGPTEGRPVVDLHDNTKRYGVSQGLEHDLWGTRHNTRFEKRRRSYLFALNDAAQPAVVTVGDDEAPCGLFSSTAVSLGLTKLCAIVRLYDPFYIARGRWEELRAAGSSAYPEEEFFDFLADYIDGPEIKRITRGAKHPDPVFEAFFLDLRKRRGPQTPRKCKGYNAQRIEKRGRRPRGSEKR